MQRQSVRDLPDNKNPTGTRCIQITIPDDDEWERDLYGEVWRLTRWMLWERDVGKNGKPVADRWLQAIRTWQHCEPPPTPPAGIEEDFDMPLRVDCDCNVFYTCPDGTEKQILNSQQVQDMVNPPGNNTPQPEQGGGCQTYKTVLQGTQQYLVPTPVSAGDTIEVSDYSGATNVSPAVTWYGPDGRLFFGGVYQGSPLPGVPGDPDPTAPDQSLVVLLNGTFYGLTGGVFTVPSGVLNVQPVIQLNSPDLSAVMGSVGFSVKVCNNQTPPWASTLNFSLNSYEGLVNVDFGTFEPGVGYHGVANGGVPFYIQLNIDIDAADLTSMSFSYGAPGAIGSGSGTVFQADGVGYGTGSTPVNGTNNVFGQSINADDITNVLAVLDTGVGGADCWISSWTIRGTGPKPSQLP